MKPATLNAKLLCYLTPNARYTYDWLIGAGWEPDLALACMESWIPDTQLWELPLEETREPEARDE